jgi:hypothetical protein
MTSVPRWLGVLVLLAAAVAAHAALFGPDEQPTSHTKPRHQYHGFSVKPPTGPGWVVRISEQIPDRAVYRHLLPTKTHTFVAVVSLVRLDQTLPVEEALVPKGIANMDRTEVLENTHQADTSRKTTCIRFSLHFREKHAANSPDATLDTTDRGFVCAHPTIPGMAVRASFSERGLESELDPGLWTELDDFLKGVQIESAPGVPAA